MRGVGGGRSRGGGRGGGSPRRGLLAAAGLAAVGYVGRGWAGPQHAVLRGEGEHGHLVEVLPISLEETPRRVRQREGGVQHRPHLVRLGLGLGQG